MRKLALVAIIGLAAQLVDGALGMAYGATSTSLLLSAGLAPAVVSATVHLAEIGTTAASGAAHWRFRNVDWRTVSLPAVPGAIGGFAGFMDAAGGGGWGPISTPASPPRCWPAGWSRRRSPPTWSSCCRRGCSAPRSAG